MTIGIALLCRYTSKRLPGKILKDINGRPIISYIIERIRYGAPDRPLVVATSQEATDDPIAAYCRRASIVCFRGSLADVAGRFLQCMEINEWDFGVRINGDNLFVDPFTLNAMLAIADTNQYDFVSNVPGRTFPIGMSVEIVRRKFYRDQMENESNAFHREHVTSLFYEKPHIGRRYIYINTICPEAAGLNLAVDIIRDLKQVSHIIERGGVSPASLTLKQIYELATKKLQPSPWKGSSGPLLIAEIGGNHEGSFEIAKAMCDQAIKSGADCVKFQLYRGDTLVSKIESPERYRHFQKFELAPEQHLELAKRCRQAGIIYTASVWDIEMLEWIDPYLDFYKIGSGDLTAWPLLTEFARRGKPILLSTGLATLEEILQTVDHIQKVDDRYRHPEMLCLMQCTSMYPIPDCEANLRIIDVFRAQTKLAVGYSDHTVGSTALLAAAAMGAEVLEFHFTDTREGKTFRDHQVSLTAQEVKQLKQDIAKITLLRGRDVKEPTSSELENHHDTTFRRGVYLKRDFSAGEVISESDIALLRPAIGTDARDVDTVVGSIARSDIGAWEALYPNSLKERGK